MRVIIPRIIFGSAGGSSDLCWLLLFHLLIAPPHLCPLEDLWIKSLTIEGLGVEIHDWHPVLSATNLQFHELIVTWLCFVFLLHLYCTSITLYLFLGNNQMLYIFII